MRRKTTKLKAALAIAAFLAMMFIVMAYRRDSDFEIFINHYSNTTDEIVKAIKDNPTSEGVVEAHKILGAKKAGLKRELAVLKMAKGSQVNGATLARLQENIQSNRAKITDLFVNDPAVLKAEKEDPQFLSNTKELIDDYKSILE